MTLTNARNYIEASRLSSMSTAALREAYRQTMASLNESRFRDFSSVHLRRRYESARKRELDAIDAELRGREESKRYEP
ncbi:hypothetical protein [Thermophilibacter sp.]